MKLIILTILMYTLSSWECTYYGKAFHGNYTYSGERFDMNGMTCASNVFRMGLKLKITNIENGKSVIVRVTDRGSMPNHVIDLSEGAFKQIANLKQGRVKIKVHPIIKRKNIIFVNGCAEPKKKKTFYNPLH
jgi:rare lipoprotein A